MYRFRLRLDLDLRLHFGFTTILNLHIWSYLDLDLGSHGFKMTQEVSIVAVLVFLFGWRRPKLERVRNHRWFNKVLKVGNLQWQRSPRPLTSTGDMFPSADHLVFPPRNHRKPNSLHVSSWWEIPVMIFPLYPHFHDMKIPYNVRPPFDSVQLVPITPITMVYCTQITN